MAPAFGQDSELGNWRSKLRNDDLTLVILSVWLAFVFLIGGGDRPDIESLMILRPLAVLILAFGVWRFSADDLRQHRLLLALAAASIALHLAQLIPLPPAVWRSLPGRQIIDQIDHAALLGEVWRPLSMAPEATRNSMWALLVPLSVLGLAVQLDPRDRHKLIIVIVLVGLTSALLSIVQMLGPPNGPLYFYRITNDAYPVGLFANRNHQALFLATLPALLAVWAQSRFDRGLPRTTAQRWMGMAAALAATLLVTVVVLVSGSRSATVALIVVLVAVVATLLRSMPIAEAGAKKRRVTKRGRVFIWVGLGGALALAAVAGLVGHAASVQRLLSTDTSTEMRLLMLPTIAQMIVAYAPFGTGMGSFEKVFQLHESRQLLRPFYANHAHNDWMELALTGGAPAVILVAVALVGVIFNARALYGHDGQLSSQDRLTGRLGLLVLAVFALGSLTDYPLRVPSLGSVAVIALVWTCVERPRLAAK